MPYWASVPSSRLQVYENAIDGGSLLMMVDVPKVQVEDITVLVKTHHPEVYIKGAQPIIPTFR